MDVKKIFIILISVVACLVIGAFVLNTILPNALATGINTIEGAIRNGTGIQIDINGDGDTEGNNNGDAISHDGAGFIDENGVGVGGSQGFGLSNGNGGGNGDN